MRGLVFKPVANSYVVPFTNYIVFPEFPTRTETVMDIEQEGDLREGTLQGHSPMSHHFRWL